eukprot:scaffold124492_cov73-Phaeocystis_antarctica.AAC.3
MHGHEKAKASMGNVESQSSSGSSLMNIWACPSLIVAASSWKNMAQPRPTHVNPTATDAPMIATTPAWEASTSWMTDNWAISMPSSSVRTVVRLPITLRRDFSKAPAAFSVFSSGVSRGTEDAVI